MHDLLLVFLCKYISILHHFWDIVDYFPKFKEVTWLWSCALGDCLSIQRLILHMASQCTKFEVSSLSRSRDILGGLKIKNWSRDMTMPLSGTFCLLGWNLLRSTGTLYLKSLCSLTTKKKGNTKCRFGVICGLGVTQGHQLCHHSVEHMRLPIRIWCKLSRSIFEL